MGLDLRQNLKLSQQLLMTPQLQQAIKLLQLSRLELEQYISQQLTENPLLEENADNNPAELHEEQREKETSSDELVGSELQDAFGISAPNYNEENETPTDWETISRMKESVLQSLQKGSQSNNSDDEGMSYENNLSIPKNLSEHLLEQLGELELTEPEKKIASLLIGNLDEKGYLKLDLEEFCQTENCDPELTEGVLDSLQHLDPSGIAARNLQECLLIQLRELQLRTPTIETIIKDHLHLLETRNYLLIAKSMKIPMDEVIKQVQIIGKLDPIPARGFLNNPLAYIVPDVFVFKVSGRWVVSLNEEGIPQLKISSYYRNLSGQVEKGVAKEYLADKIRAASWLIKSLHQRQRTIFRVTECIVAKQLEYFEMGNEHLKPMILKDVAEEIGMHESTISRVTSNKYVHTPRGVFELKYFFNSSVSRTGDGGDMASESVKVMIKQMVDKENPKHPFSDQKIVSLLEDKGIHLARRTVAKYREQLKILPSSKRKKLF